MRFLNCANNYLDLTYPQVMGIMNVTPDSLYGGSRHISPPIILQYAEQMVAEGAAIIDIGGESTRPGAIPISLQEELDRVIPVIEVCRQLPVIISVDTRTPAVMQAAIQAGVGFINDINALRAENALSIVANSQAAVCLMHMQGEPQTMQQNPYYTDVVTEVKNFLAERVAVCLAAGITQDRLVIDPGFGFGKHLQHNLSLLNHLDIFTKTGVPVLVGLSRKSMIKDILGLPIVERLPASLALAVLAVSKGASIVRTHDVKATVEAIRMATAVLERI